MVVPAGRTFLLKPVDFQGPCKPPSINVQIEGNIVAPRNPGEWEGRDVQHWLEFSDVNGLLLSGSGVIDGQGSHWWLNPQRTRPIALAIKSCNNVEIRGLKNVNSASSHMHIGGCNGVIISDTHISAPGSSPNTDGIDIGFSTHVYIANSLIQTGDDCIAIGDGSSFITISGITCGPGHGISIGSLGVNGENDKVEEVHVCNCTLQGTSNGARIKTWQGGSGYARKISFEDIQMDGVANPILIDQYYCPNQPVPCKNQPHLTLPHPLLLPASTPMAPPPPSLPRWSHVLRRSMLPLTTLVRRPQPAQPNHRR
ncbi:probable polygalacturonase At3g15720 [Carica papaya]|uniref:probable polygalacturonase At3g15720 n=1 Tax=Carica papaya TaxID=3649 RepID=UPI000B8C9FA2|nr:probable polygalacturonase At3g15720 [Carica papaya]